MLLKTVPTRLPLVCICSRSPHLLKISRGINVCTYTLNQEMIFIMPKVKIQCAYYENVPLSLS